MTISNLPPPDELAKVRDTIKALEQREAELKGLLRDNPDLRTGNRYAAQLKEATTSQVDLKELRAMHGDLVAEYTFPKTVIRIELREISEDGELLSIRRKPQS